MELPRRMIADLSLPNQTFFTADDIIRKLKDLPSAPKVLPRLKQLLSDGNSAIHEIVALVRFDPGIAARVLQMANSVYFNHTGVRCFTVDEAVQRVGFNEVYELVAYAVASQVLVRPLEPGPDHPRPARDHPRGRPGGPGPR